MPSSSATASGYFLQLDGVSASIGERRVLHRVNLEVSAGEFVAIMGPNGAGKTTLLKTVAGVIPAARGRITFAGERIESLALMERVKRGIVYVPEGMRIFPEMSIVENLEVGAYLQRNRIRERMEMIFDLFPELGRRRTAPAKALSGGEQRMVTLARGLMGGARLLLLDDPLQGLSPKAITRFCEVFRTLKQGGLTFLVAGQHVRRILNMAGRAFLIEEGRTTLSGASADVLRDQRFQQALFGLVKPQDYAEQIPPPPPV